VVMALDSATPGRMAITYYRELQASEFLERIKAGTNIPHGRRTWGRIASLSERLLPAT
jgi:hypothetical protein